MRVSAPRIVSRTAAAIILLSSVLACGSLSAEDRVTVRPPESAGLMTVSGDILGYDDETLTLRVRSGVALQTYDSREVVAVEIQRTAGHLAGLVALDAGQIDEARAQFQKGLMTEQRGWVRHEMLGGLIRCHLRRDDYPQAVALFMDIVLNEPHTRQWDIAPLAWGSETVSEDLRANARRWLLQNSEAVRLVAASLLLHDPDGNARKEMESLARSQDRYIGSLARAQLWRIALDTPNNLSAQMLDRWRREVERMPESIRSGPWFLIGRGHQLRNEPDEAISAYLRVFMVHAGNEPLAARSGFEAALALTRLNRHTEADAISRELIDRFGWTTFATEARTALKAARQ